LKGSGGHHTVASEVKERRSPEWGGARETLKTYLYRYQSVISDITSKDNWEERKDSARFQTRAVDGLIVPSEGVEDPGGGPRGG